MKFNLFFLCIFRHKIILALIALAFLGISFVQAEAWLSVEERES